MTTATTAANTTTSDSTPRKCDKERWSGQKDKLVEWLKSGGTITQDEARAKYGVMRLAAQISELRKAGLNIQKNMIEYGTASVAEYFLAAD